MIRKCVSLVGLSVVFLATLSCGSKPANKTPLGGGDSEGQGSYDQPSALQKRLLAMTPAMALPPSDNQRHLSASLDGYFQQHGTRRHYLHLDKPLYRPGETIWFRAWELSTPTMTGSGSGHGILAELISPKGATVLQKRIQVHQNVATNDFELPPTIQGGEYIVRLSSDLGGTTERKFIVSQYDPPRIKKKAEFTRKAYGPGDKVSAAVSLNLATGEPLAQTQFTALVQVDGAEIVRKPFATDGEGNAMVSFQLPAGISRGDGLLTLLVAEGGTTESLQKRIPITLKQIRFEMFPEGGDLVSGVPGRVYFMAKNSLDKPADVSGRVVNQNGSLVAEFSSLYNGLGRFEITPKPGESYYATITKPHGIEGKYPLPDAADSGCTLAALDDVHSARPDFRVGVFCSRDQDVVATASLREKRLMDIAVRVKRDKPSVIAFPVPAGSQGAIRVTIFDDKLTPLAERLVYRGRGADMKVAISSDRASYSPRDPVTLTVETRDLAGKPVIADLSLAVVDDTVLSFADDKSAHMLARIYLESEMPGQEIEEPNFYFSDDKKAAAALDLVMGTQGWRRFDWQPVLNPAPPPMPTSTAYHFDDDMAEAEGGEDFAAAEPMDAPAPARDRPRVRAAPPAARPVGGDRPVRGPVNAAQPMRLEEGRMGRIAGQGRAFDAKMDMADRRAFDKDEEWAGDEMQVAGWAPVRVFPAPNYEGRYSGPRTDFRDTIHWVPSVITDESGTAKVSFYLSDAVTSFRVSAEGVSRGGLPGRGEELVQSKLPVSLAVKMPLEVSKGDQIQLPVTLTNETDRTYGVAVNSQFGPAFRVVGGVPKMVKLAHKEKKTFFAELEVVGDGANPDEGLMAVAIDTDNLKDEVEKTVRVVPLGFPQEISLAGTIDKKARHELNLAGALPGSIEATVQMYPSPLATMIEGTEAIIREPYGCFEQASSANYPNIMVLSYLEENEAAEPALIERTMGHLDKGYKMLAGYESPKKGYEWFGGDPGHEALTAYGLMEFVDMGGVYGDVDNAMVGRTRAWLKSRRDGKGGYKRNSRALDSFGRASDEVTNGYIAYALAESGDKDLAPELALQKQVATATKDPYVMALAANVLMSLEPGAPSTKSALSRLVGMQAEDGSFAGADHSITRSGGSALTIETTSLAALALMKAGDSQMVPVRKAIDWLNQNRGGHGNFASTQATVLALKAMAEYANVSRATQSDGVATLMVNGKRAGRVTFEKGQRGALVFDDLAASLKPGKNVIELTLDAESQLPYSIAIGYRSKLPASSKEAAVQLSTSLDKKKVPMGEGVTMKVVVTNRTEQGQPMTLARVGIPGGLTFQTWQLKELVDKKLIDFFETREREVVLYFRSMAPRSVAELELNLLASVPGQYVAPASRAYLYYTDEYKHWVEPTAVMITR